MDLYFQGRALYFRGFTPDNLARARDFYERALKLDSGNVDALVGAATVDVIVAASYMTDDPRAVLDEAEASLTKALAAAPNHAGAQSDNPVYLSQRERIIEGMRMAGVPEG
jgi:hypothetical protein